MNIVNAVVVTLILGVESTAIQAEPSEDYSASVQGDTYEADASFYDALGIRQETIRSLQSHPVVQRNVLYGTAGRLKTCQTLPFPTQSPITKPMFRIKHTPRSPLRETDSGCLFGQAE